MTVIAAEEAAGTRRWPMTNEARHALIDYAIVFPGGGDPAKGWVSADSPLGSAVLGARAGDSVHVAAPVGRWRVTVVAVA